MAYKREDIKTILTGHIASVTFTKVDGTERVMKCTLQESFLPTPVASDEEINRNRKPSEAVQVAWDLDKEGWRSFRVDSVKSVEVLK